MATRRDLLELDETLNNLATLYQFRRLDDRLYGTLTVSQSYCLRILYFQGGRTMGELAAGLGVKMSTMTGVIDQLEDQRLVKRIDHPSDRRSLRVELTAKGRALYKGAHDAFLSHIEPLVERLSPAALHGILDFLGNAIHAIQSWRSHPRKVRRRDTHH